MHGLSLCAGIGGLDLAIEIAFSGYRPVAAVENNAEAARRFRRRFPQAKVFRDVVGFDGRPFHGIVDYVVAGWPCQPHSVAGKRRGTTDERWIWDHVARILDECGAALFFGENVSGLLRDTASPDESDRDLDEPANDVIGGMGTVLRDLAALGFVSTWGSLRAAQVGASHGRRRVFLLAYHPGRGFGINRGPSQFERNPPGHAEQLCGQLENSGCSTGRREPDSHNQPGRRTSADNSGSSGDVADADDGFFPVARPRPQERSGPAGPVLANSEFESIRAEQLDDSRRRSDSTTPNRPMPGNESRKVLAEPAGPGLSQRGDDRGLRELEAPERADSTLEDPAWFAAAPGRSRRRRGIREAGDSLVFAPGPADPLWPDILRTSPHLAPALSPVTAAIAIAIQQGTFDLQAEIEPQLRRLADGVARWLVERRPRLQCCGNGVVPLQAAAVFTVLAERMGLTDAKNIQQL